MNEETLPYANQQKNNPVYKEVLEKMKEISASKPHEEQVKQVKSEEMSELMSMYASGELKEPEYCLDRTNNQPYVTEGIAGQARNDAHICNDAVQNPPNRIQTRGTSGTSGTDVRPFWYNTTRGRLEISASDFIDWLASKGFRRLAGGNEDDLQLVQVSEHVIRIFSIDMLINRLDEIFHGTHDSSELVDKEYTYRDIYSRMIEKIGTLFEHKLLLTLPTEERNAPVPSRTEEYYPYQNGMVKITKSEISLIPYSTTPYRFFESEIIPRDFDLATESDTMSAEFAKFASLTCSVHPDGKVWKNDFEMWHAKLAAIGYLLSHYMDPVCTRAVIFCDSGTPDSSEANGRSGKGLMANAISKIIPMVTFNGKVFNPNRDKFAYSQIKRGTRLVCIDDVSRNFSLQPLFSILTEGVQVERKGQNSFRIPYSESPKFLLTMNSLFAGTGGSEHARKYEVPFGGFFSADYTPYEHFGHSFFDEWSTAEWRLFDNFMMWCVKYYLDKGLPAVASDELEKKRIAQVCNYSGDLEDYLRGIAGAVKNGGFIATADLIRDAREAAKDLDPEDLRKLNTKIIVKIFHLICRDMGVKVKSVRRRNELGNSLRGYAI